MFQTENPWYKKASADSIGVECIRLFAVQSLLLVFLPHTELSKFVYSGSTK